MQIQFLLEQICQDISGGGAVTVLTPDLTNQKRYSEHNIILKNVLNLLIFSFQILFTSFSFLSYFRPQCSAPPAFFKAFHPRTPAPIHNVSYQTDQQCDFDLMTLSRYGVRPPKATRPLNQGLYTIQQQKLTQ